ncbi:hypothetical protein R5W23_000092 [Gemmata sp. JC673]|uniref:DUF4198 domain-containing protein n=1 Tax=Gemmata algarum TaxID=2975278 RepID=A0ABU5ER67_9BACT|nr:hypothetical protein [Gemmata algarum]MDY3557566.1 hypothetical protein [Gemmata algarum]
MRGAVLLVLVQVSVAFGSEPERLLKVVPQRGFPAVELVTLYHTTNGKREKVEVTAFEKPTQLPSTGPFEVWVRCKGGTVVKSLDALAVNAGVTHELKVGDLFGTVEVFGDNLPRAGKIVLTAPLDPGPGEKNHVSVQTATDYRVAMCVPPGVYAVWVVPANGGRAQRVEDHVRVHAGRNVRVGD